MPASTPQQRQQTEANDHLRGLLKVAAEYYHRQLIETERGAAALTYARQKRGFTDETITRFQVGYAPEGWQHLLDELKLLGYSEQYALDAGVAIKSEKGSVYDRFRNRLMIPIRDERGRVIGFGARALNPDDTPKYLNSPQSAVFDKSGTLFGLDTAKRAIRDSETVVIVEGYMDAIQAQQAGFANVVAQMGTALTETQLALIAPRLAKRIILALDSDAAGQNATLRSLEVARQTLQADYAGRLSVDIRILHIPDAKDPDDLIREHPEQWATLIEQAAPVADFVLDVETTGISAQSTVQEREAVARRVLPLLLASENDLYRKDNLQKLAMRLRIAERDLMAWAHEWSQTQRSQGVRHTPRPPVNPVPVLDDAAEAADGMPYLPPLDYETMAVPDDTGEGSTPDGVYDPAAGMQVVTGLPPVQIQPGLASGLRLLPVPAQREAALEYVCLRLLLRQPDLYFRINRKFRELAREQQVLVKGPLGELSVEDFQHSDYRAIIQTLHVALRQDDHEPLTFLRDQLTPSLLPVLDRLFMEEADTVRERLRQRFDGDAIISWREHERRKVGVVEPEIELIDKVLRLRKQRLEREIQEMQYLQMEAIQQDDEPGSEGYIQMIMLTARAKRLIETELKELSRHFI